MTLREKNYTPLSAFGMLFRASALCTILHILLSLTSAVMPTAVMALATANFVDTAINILQGLRPRGDIYLPLVILLFVLGVVSTIGAVIQLVDARIRLNLDKKLRPAMVKSHAQLNFKHIENADSWELITRVSGDPVGSVMLSTGFIQILQIIVSIGAVLGLIVAQVWWAAIIIVAFSVPMFWLADWAGKKNYQAGRDAEEFGRRMWYLDGILIGRENVDERTIFGYSEKVDKRWHIQYEKWRVLQMKVQAKTFLIVNGSRIIVALIGLLIALTLIQPVIAGDMTAGMFMGIVAAVFSMIGQLGWQMSNSVQNIARSREYMKDLSEFTTLSKSEDVLTEPDKQPIEFHKLEFRNVRFKYPSGDRYVLDGLSFTLEAGKHYAFVGINGAGKTTITKLLTGLYTDYEGDIVINGKELRKYPASTLKALFSVVYQDFARYSISMKKNIEIGDIAGNSKQASHAAKLAGLDETIKELNNGIKTPLGKILPNGQDISGGQWQRVALARSIINRAPVKMLDEPTAALDPISESRIYGEFEKLMRGKTTIFISHRLGSTKLADEILVIDDGKITERGTHEQLMTANGAYAEMFESQRSWYV